LESSDVSLPERFGRRQGYAFITFENFSDVEKAVSEVNGKELLGREMRVQKATSGGPYISENGEQGDATTGEARKMRTRTRPKVYHSDVSQKVTNADRFRVNLAGPAKLPPKSRQMQQTLPKRRLPGQL
jgi:RNA recognition motif-containing protein